MSKPSIVRGGKAKDARSSTAERATNKPKTSKRALQLASTLFVSTLALQGVHGVLPETAHADGVADEADLHFQRGVEAYRAERWLEALEHFLASNRLVPNRNVIYNIARAYERLGRSAEAYRYYSDALANEPDAAVRERLAQSIAALATTLAVVDVESDPAGATIYVDRTDLGSVGTTPRSLALTPGEHRIIVEREGYATVTSEVVIAAVGSPQRVRLGLERIVGTARITGPEGASVHIDNEEGEAACTAPCAVEIPPGTHLIHVSRPGFATRTRQVVIAPHEEIVINTELEALAGSLLVTADETGARIEVDERTVGFTPSVVPSLAVGSHHVRISAPGYLPYEADIVIEQDVQSELREVHLEARNVIQAASRRAERIEDAPASTTILQRQDLDAFAFPTLASALQGVRGFALTSDSLYSNAAVRGLGQPNDYSNRLVVLSDGAALNENILNQPFIGYDGRVDLGDIERVEIVRGAGSVLYGSGALSGVVNLVPRGRDEPTNAEFQLSGVSNTVGRVRAAMNLRLGSDTGLRMSLSGAHSEGRDATLDIDGTQTSVRGIDRFNAFTTNGRFFHEALTIQWFFTLREIDLPTGFQASLVDRGADSRTVDDRGLLEIRFEPQVLPQLQLLTRAYANFSHYSGNLLFEQFPIAGDPNTRFEQRYNETYYGVWTGAEARFVWQPVSQLRATLGGEGVVHPLVQLDGSQTEYMQTTRTSTLSQRRPYGTYSGYALVDWTPLELVSISLGARFDYWDNTQSSTTTGAAPDFINLSPRLAVILHPSTSDTLKLMGARAFRAPSVYENYYTDNGSTQLESTCCGTTLTPEVVYQAELEYTHRFDPEWTVLGSIHGQYDESQIDSTQVPEAVLAARGFPTDASISYYRNTTSPVLVYGADLVVRREFRNGWMFDLQLGTQDARFLNTTGNNRVPNVPPLTGSIRGVVPIIGRALQAAVRVSAEGQRRIDMSSDAETNWAAIADIVVSGTVNEFGLRYAVGVYNVFDWSLALPASPFASRTIPQAGRTFMLSLTLTL